MEIDRISDYLLSLETVSDEALEYLRKKAETDRVPIIRRQTESFLSMMVKMLRPEKILEIGTATGFSSIVMMKAAKEADLQETFIKTIENYEKRIPEARENFKTFGYQFDINLIEGDAGTILKELSAETFDMVFLDAAKGQYLTWLPDIMKLMHKGSVLIADNVLQDGTVMESRFVVDRRDRTTHSRIQPRIERIF